MAKPTPSKLRVCLGRSYVFKTLVSHRCSQSQKQKHSFVLGKKQRTRHPLSLKLLINKATKKVVFAEAGKETVDFLCSILTLPMGTVIRLLQEHGMEGCLSNLYQSIESLSDDYIQPNQHKDSVLKPMACSSFQTNSPVFPSLTYAPTNEKKFYRCWSNSCSHYVTDSSESICPNCRKAMDVQLSFVKGDVAGKVADGGSGGSDGFVKGVVTYMVMDDLSVAPMSTITGITLLNKFNVTDVGSLQEEVVHLDMPKALKLLKISLQSKNVLTAVFL